MKLTIRGTGDKVNITKTHVVAKGGEGVIYIKDGVVYKICHAGKMIPDGKFQELAVLNHPNIIKPEQVLLDSKGKPVGYTMKLVPNSVPLAQILTKSYRDRENVTFDQMGKLIQDIRDGIEHIHSKDILQVDGNEMNYMVSLDYETVSFIDVNSFQTKHYPAEALMLSVRDWHVEKKNGVYIWTELSDWFSFAIISFYMWTGIHPFKGAHPRFKNVKTRMEDQMKANVSVLNSETKYPAAAVYPFDVIPDVYMQWYKALFERGERHPAPQDFHGKILLVAKVKEISGSDNFEIKEIHDFGEMLVGFIGRPGTEVSIGPEHVFVNQAPKPKPYKKIRAGITNVMQIPVSAHLENNIVHLTNLKTQEKIDYQGNGSDLMSCEGRLYVQSNNRIVEIQFIESGKNIMAAPKVVCDILPNATQMFQGTIIQYLFEGYFVSVFPKSGIAQQFHIKELDEYQITEAKYENGVLMVVGISKGKYDRFVIRFEERWGNYEIARKIEDIIPTGLNFTVLENGVCVCITEEEKIELFSSRSGSQNVKSISDPVIESDMRLCRVGSQVMFAKGNKLFKLSMK